MDVTVLFITKSEDYSTHWIFNIVGLFLKNTDVLKNTSRLYRPKSGQ